MTRALPWKGRFALLLFLPVGLFPFLGPGQRSANVSRIIPGTPNDQVAAERTPSFTDWTNHHALYSLSGKSFAIEAARRDPRAAMRWREREQSAFGQRIERSAAVFLNHRTPRQFPSRTSASMDRDWAIYLGSGGTSPSMFPAKYTFNATTAASCTNDFVVFPNNATPSGTQPNITAFYYLYSGTTGGNGICNARTGIGTLGGLAGTDNTAAAVVYWNYSVRAVSGGVVTSPSLSFDGTKVAFVETGASSAHFHVLAWKASDGQATTGGGTFGTGPNRQAVTSPKSITSFAATAPAAGSGTATDLAFGSTTDTLSSPYIDYSNDTAYVGNDAGVLYRFKNVFCILTTCANATPSLDATWGTGGAVTVCSGKLTAPVLDFINMTVFVGCSDGKLYSINQSGTIKSLVIGDGVASKTYGGIVDPPVVDGLNEFVYAVSGSANGGANGVLVQAAIDFSSSVAVPIGLGNLCNMHSPTPNNTYFTSPTTSGAMMYVGGYTTTGTVSQPCSSASTGSALVLLYASTFNSSGILNSGAPANSFSDGGGPGYEWAPLTEFFNSNTGVDWIFASALQSQQGNVGSANITSGFPATFATIVTEGNGASGMIVDNNSSSNQASSLYLGAQQQNANCNNNTSTTLTGGCAVKLTQNGLN
jgi:hypothetical protein